MVGIGKTVFSGLAGDDADSLDVVAENESVQGGDKGRSFLIDDIGIPAGRFVVGCIDLESVVEARLSLLIEEEAEPTWNPLVNLIPVREAFPGVLRIERIVG